MKIKRLEHLVEVLEQVRDNDLPFNMGTVGYNAAGQYPNETMKVTKLSCGTQACAGGWAGVDFKFRRAGLWLEYINWGFSGYYRIRFKDWYDAEALAEFFGLEQYDVDHLFAFGVGRGGYRTIDEEINVVKNFIKRAIDKK